MKLKLIAAIGKNNELGKNNSLPLWNLKTDFKRFKDLTTNQVVIMGRKTFESLPEKWRPLPNRRNIVLTRDKNWGLEGVENFESLEEALPHLASPCKGEEQNICIIGGGIIFKEFINLVDELHITHVDGEFEADVFFPTIDMEIWKICSAEKVLADEKNSHDTVYTVYIKK